MWCHCCLCLCSHDHQVPASESFFKIIDFLYVFVKFRLAVHFIFFIYSTISHVSCNFIIITSNRQQILTVNFRSDPDREPPFFFQKPPDSIVVCSTQHSSSTPSTTSIPYPPKTSSLHYEGELIVAISKDGYQIPVHNAMDHVYGYSIGCDLTRRDLQSDAKQKGRPWDAAKGFDFSCPLSPIVRKEEVFKSLSMRNRGDDENYYDRDDTTTNEEKLKSMQLILKVNGSIRQQSSIGCMIYSVSEIISHLSGLFRLQAGDLILTGTPAGVSEVNVGDKVSISCGSSSGDIDGNFLMPCEFVISPQIH